MITHLIEKANSSNKVKLFDCYLGSSAKFFNGKVENVKLTEEECEQFRNWLEQSPDFVIGPMVTSGGLVAWRKTDKPALPVWASGNRSIEELLG